MPVSTVTPDTIQSMSNTADTLLQWRMTLDLFPGAVIGSLVAVVPAAGGLMGPALLLPFTFSIPAIAAIVFKKCGARGDVNRRQKTGEAGRRRARASPRQFRAESSARSY